MKPAPAFTEIKGELPLTLYRHGAFQEKKNNQPENQTEHRD